MGAISAFIYEELCKEYRIPYIIPTNVRVKNIFAFSADTQLRFPQIDATYKRLVNDKIKPDFNKAEELYNDLMGELKNPQYFDRLNSRFNIIKYDSLRSRIRWLGSVVKSVGKEILRWQVSREFRK